MVRAQGESPEARSALAELCQAYWQPVYRFLLREGRGPDAAAELTQEFCARVLAGNTLRGAERGRARFRSYLLGALKHFLANERVREQRLKRGGGQVTESLDRLAEEETALEVPDPAGMPPDAYFDREWALAVMDGALRALQREFVVAGKAREFDVLKPWLAGGGEALSYAEASQELGVSEAALKVAVHRLRKRFRELIRAELAQTVPDEGEIEDELRYLVEVLARG